MQYNTEKLKKIIALVQQRTDFFVILAWNIKNTLQKA